MKGRADQRRENFHIFLVSAYITAVLCLFAAILSLSLLRKELPESPVTEQVSVTKEMPFRLAIFLEDGFSGGFSSLILCDCDPTSGELKMAGLPALLSLGNRTLGEYALLEGPAGALDRLKSQYGVSFEEYFVLERVFADHISKKYGNLQYHLPAAVSYYDPATGNSFLAAEGRNTATGTEFLKLITLSAATDASDGVALAASLFSNWCVQALPKEPTKGDAEFFLSVGRSSFSAVEADKMAAALCFLKKKRAEVLLLETEKKEGVLQLSSDACLLLQNRFAKKKATLENR